MVCPWIQTRGLTPKRTVRKAQLKTLPMHVACEVKRNVGGGGDVFVKKGASEGFMIQSRGMCSVGVHRSTGGCVL